MDRQLLLITIFLYISNQYENELRTACQRFGSNCKPAFTDEEAITVFLFGIMQKRFEIKDIYNYACNHPGERFPALPSYTAFVQRLNRLEGLFPVPAGNIIKDFAQNSVSVLQKIRLIDSLPVILAEAERSSSAGAAQGFADKGYCASGGGYHYGVKLHIPAIGREGALPLPECTGITPACGHDPNFFREISSYLHGCEILRFSILCAK